MKLQLQLSALLVTVLLAQSAFAFYNPQTGRWLNRDPVAEPGHEVLRLSASEERASRAARTIARDTQNRIKARTIRDDAGYQVALNDPVGFLDPHGLDIYTMERNASTCHCGPLSCDPINAFHMAVCVDTWDADGTSSTGRACFSYMSTGGGIYGPKGTWLGWSSWTFCCLEGRIYRDAETEAAAGGKILRRHKTTPQQDAAWLTFMTTTGRVGTKDGYSVARHNCRKYSNMEFDDAPNHYGP